MRDPRHDPRADEEDERRLLEEAHSRWSQESQALLRQDADKGVAGVVPANRSSSSSNGNGYKSAAGSNGNGSNGYKRAAGLNGNGSNGSKNGAGGPAATVPEGQRPRAQAHMTREDRATPPPGLRPVSAAAASSSAAPSSSGSSSHSNGASGNGAHSSAAGQEPEAKEPAADGSKEEDGGARERPPAWDLFGNLLSAARK
jgi:hypothetical protein